jgi:hypothetical protein
MILRLSVPIALFWLALAAITNVFVPQLEKVAQAHNGLFDLNLAISMKSGQVAVPHLRPAHWLGLGWSATQPTEPTTSRCGPQAAVLTPWSGRDESREVAHDL